MQLTFRAHQTMAAQTNFVKLSLIQQSYVSFGLRTLILVCEITEIKSRKKWGRKDHTY